MLEPEALDGAQRRQRWRGAEARGAGVELRQGGELIEPQLGEARAAEPVVGADVQRVQLRQCQQPLAAGVAVGTEPVVVEQQGLELDDALEAIDVRDLVGVEAQLAQVTQRIQPLNAAQRVE